MDAPVKPSDQFCVICEKWFGIFEVSHQYVDKKFVYVCHGDVLLAVEKAVRAAKAEKIQRARDEVPVAGSFFDDM